MKTDNKILRQEKELDIRADEVPVADDLWDEEDYDADEEPYDSMQELKMAAWNIVRENPGIEVQDWIEMLIKQYPSEVVDAFGSNPFEAFPLMEDFWDCNDYEDPETGECRTFADWSEYYATDPDALRDRLDSANERIRELENEIGLLRAERKKRTTGPPDINNKGYKKENIEKII